MFKEGDRIVFHEKSHLRYIVLSGRDNVIDIKPVKSKGIDHMTFTNLPASLFRFDYNYYRNKKINKLLTEINK
jgi:hypothetical protein